MAVTNPQAIAFTQMARKMAQIRLTDYYSAKVINNTWNGQSIASLIPNDTTTIADGAGAAGDGRPIVTGAAVTNMVTRCQEVITDLEANSNAKLNTLLALTADGQHSEV